MICSFKSLAPYGAMNALQLLRWMQLRNLPLPCIFANSNAVIAILNQVRCFAEAGGQHVFAMAKAVELLGLHGCLTKSIMDSGEGLPARWSSQNAFRPQSQRVLHEKHNDIAEGRIRIWLGIWQIMNSTDRLLLETKNLARELKTGIHMVEFLGFLGLNSLCFLCVRGLLPIPPSKSFTLAGFKLENKASNRNALALKTAIWRIG